MTTKPHARPRSLTLRLVRSALMPAAVFAALAASAPAWSQDAPAPVAAAPAATVQSEEDRLNAAAMEGDAESKTEAQAPVDDPLESVNRVVFRFNDAVDGAVVAPVARAYQQLAPTPVQIGVSNFFGNLRDVWSTVNLGLQGRGRDGLAMLLRVATNTTLGFGGLLDLGTPMGLNRVSSDLGLTLGHWGVPSGPFVVLPLLGPSTLRDTVSTGASLSATSSSLYLKEPAQQYFATGLNLVDQRARLLGATDVLGVAALDKYSFIRGAYLAQRNDSVLRTFDPASGPTAAERAPGYTP